MPAVWRRVQDHLVVLLPTLTGWGDVDVSDGPPDDWEGPYRYCAVGSTLFDDFGGSYEQTRNAEGGWQGAVQESGQVRCELVVATSEDDPDQTDIAAVRAAAFDLVDTLEAELARDPSLGGLLGPLAQASLSVDVQPLQTDRGALQRLLVTVNYQTYL